MVKREGRAVKKEFLEDVKLELDNGVLLHIQLADLLRNVITRYSLSEGDPLPTEKYFCERFGVSRSTVRKAMDALMDEGLVARVQGKGTFVAKGKLSRKIERIYSFSNEIRASGLAPSSKVVSITLDYQDEFLRNILTVKENEKIYCINRLRLADNEPLLVEYTYVPFSFIGVLSSKALETGSLYQILKDAGIVPYQAVESYEAVVLKRRVVNLLGCKANCPGFKIERKTSLVTGETYEYTRAYMRGDRSKLYVTLDKDATAINRTIE